MRHRKAPFLMLMLMLAGCFNYAPIAPAEVTPSMTIRARGVADGGLGTIEGTVQEVTPTSLSVLPETSGGTSSDPVSVDFRDLGAIERRSFDGTRTSLLAGATIAIGIASLFMTEVIGGGGGTQGGSGDFSLIPAFRIPIGR